MELFRVFFHQIPVFLHISFRLIPRHNLSGIGIVPHPEKIQRFMYNIYISKARYAHPEIVIQNIIVVRIKSVDFIQHTLRNMFASGAPK